MGVERAVTHWYVQHQRISDEIAALEAKLVQVEAELQEPSDAVERRTDIERRLVTLRAMLRTLGPCPKPMMG